MKYRLRLSAVVVLLLGWLSPVAAADKPTPEQVAFFEKNIRPVLVRECYSCHSAGAEKVRGELKLDTRDDLRKGGENGAAIVPGDPKNSLLMIALRQDHD